MIPMKKWMRVSTKAEQRELARRARTSVGQLRQLAGKHRTSSADLALRLERAARVLHEKNVKLPLLLREQLATSCRACEFAKHCRPLV